MTIICVAINMYGMILRGSLFQKVFVSWRDFGKKGLVYRKNKYISDLIKKNIMFGMKVFLMLLLA